MRQRLRVLGLSLITLGACAPQEPAAAPLAAPPPAPAEPMAVAPPPPAEGGQTATTSAPAPAELGPEQSVKLYQECWAAFNAKDFAKFAPCFDDAAVSDNVDSGQPPLVGKDIVEKKVKAFTTAFPDITGEAQLTLASGNTVVGVWLMRGTHQGELPGPNGALAATNKKMGHLLGHVIELKGGKAVKERSYSDSRTLLGQLGVVPGPVRKVQEQGAAERPVVIATGSATEKANLETYKKYLEAFNKHDAAQVEPFLSDDFVLSDQSIPVDLVGKKEVQKGHKDLWKGSSDVKIENKSAWAAGDYVVTQSTFTGTNDGPMPSMKLWQKTGKPFNLSFLEITRLENGKLKKQWVFANGMAFAAQLGILPPARDAKPARAAAGAKPAKPAAAKPGDPAKPAAKPVDAEKPAAPAKPATPAAPAAPAKPTAPSAPAKPADPVKPADPAKPPAIK